MTLKIKSKKEFLMQTVNEMKNWNSSFNKKQCLWWKYSGRIDFVEQIFRLNCKIKSKDEYEMHNSNEMKTEMVASMKNESVMESQVEWIFQLKYNIQFL